jgi:ADP-ribose pyrophosphatase
MSESDARRGEIVFSTPFFDVVAKPMPGGGTPHYSLQKADYVTVLALTPQGRIPLVRQYRPTVDAITLELPSGLVDPGEEPLETADRELQEESGWKARRIEPLARLRPDVGRLGNHLWVFFADDLEPASRPGDPDEEIERVELVPEDLVEAIRSGELVHAPNLAVVMLGVLHGRLPASLLAPR